MPPVQSRRTLLRRTGVTLATVGLGGLAGCLGSDTEATRTEQTPTATSTPTPTPTGPPPTPRASGPWPTTRAGPRHLGRTTDAGPSEGSVAWTTTLDAPVVSEPIVADSAVFVATEAGELVSLAVADGSVRWRVPTRTNVAPAYADGSLVVADDGLRALDVRTGEEQWSAALDGSPTSPPTVAEGAVYVAVADESLAAVGLDGTVQYETAPYTQLGGVASPTVTADRITLGATNGYYGVRDGRRAWKRSLGGSVAGPPVATDRSVFLATDGGSLLATKPTSGGVQWERDLPSGVPGSPVVADGVLSLVAGDRLRALRATSGDDLWQTPLSAQETTTPALAGGMLYLGDSAGTVLAVDVDDGITEWDVEVDGPVRVPPAVAGKSLFVGTEAGTVARVD
ncbi:PQQ-binding-like beta-propeller repeat protein [Salinirubrum litoreum]|uniref:PQQ-binding-like beta-propeller repeat protein n=1 Tax=Salinirubrum litoreum TaxID=1126234 RepID=A0ABD5R8R8_9EURY|nr:PQQ-binding-like beta-propeller repeat protein [Salinirubrum litoreum]